jgi:hypothetical protein
MRIFIGYGYNKRDAWIEQHVLPILSAMAIETTDGKKLHGEVLQEGVKQRIDQADALVGFCTLRVEGKKDKFNTHPWVRDEMMYALGRKMPVIEVRENGVKSIPGLKGDREYIKLNGDRLACVKDLVEAVGSWSMRRLLLAPRDLKVRKQIHQAWSTNALDVTYRARINNADRKPRTGRLDVVNNGFYLNVIGLPAGSLVQVEGRTASGTIIFNTGFASADVVRVEF